MLEKQAGFKSSDKEAVRAALENLGATHFNVRDGSRKYAYKMHIAQHNDLTLVSSSCTGATETAYDPATFVRQYFNMASTASVRFKIAGKTEELSKAASSIIVPADRPLYAESATNHNLLVLRIETSALKSKLQAMLGTHVSSDIEFSSLVSNGLTQQSMRQALIQFASDLDFWGDQLLPSVRLELEQALIVRFLLCSQHNFSSKLATPASAPSPLQLRDVAAYIEANWDKPLDIEMLAATFDVSTRSLFRHFKKFRECSPQDFIKSVRLKNVRTLLEAADGEASVMAIAMKCGFHSLGHFARDYRKMFGELPSETVRRIRPSFRY